MSDSRPSATVVIDNYNYERYLAEAIESAIDQGEDVPVIVVDDGSTDGSVEIARSFGPRVEVIEKQNGGQASAFNVGIAAVTTDLVVLLDADDVLLPGAVDQIRDHAAARPDAVMFLHPLTLIDAHGEALPGSLPEPGRSLPDGELVSSMLRSPDDIPWQPTSGLSFRTAAARAVLPAPEAPFRTCGDVYLVSTVPLSGPVKSLPRAGAAYRQHGANLHHRTGFDLQRTVQTVERTRVTHDEIRRRAVELGLRRDGDSLPLLSVSDTASQMLINRLQQPRGSLRERASLVLQGGRAAVRRVDVGVGRRLAMAGWFVAAAVAPTRFLDRLAGLALTR